MDLFQTPDASHQHSLRTISLLNAYDTFMDSIECICDMGCGHGFDILWWANATYQDDNDVLQPRNYRCVAVDLDTSKLPSKKPSNLHIFEKDFESKVTNAKIDLIWSHDSFRYTINPLSTLKVWNEQMSENGMLVLILPQTVNIVYNKPVTRTFTGSYFSYNITNLMYMLAVNGFDCKDGHFVKYPNDPWIHCVAYKSEHAPMDPKKTSWYDLVSKNLLPDSANKCIDKYGYLKQEELQTHWLDGQFINWSKV